MYEYASVCVTVQSPQLVKKKEEQPLTVNQFQFSGWDKNAATPTSRGSLMTLLEMVERSQIKTGNHAVVIHCMYVSDVVAVARHFAVFSVACEYDTEAFSHSQSSTFSYSQNPGHVGLACYLLLIFYELKSRYCV